MSQNDTNLMEGDILTEENLSPDNSKGDSTHPENLETKNQLKKKPTKTLGESLRIIKRPKFITIILTFLILITNLTMVAIISPKTVQEEIVDPNILVTSPEPIATIDQELQKINDEISSYERKVDGLSTSIKNYPPPKVDLEVKF